MGHAASSAKSLDINAQELTPPDLKVIKDRGTLVVAMLKQDTFPFFYEKDGLLRGTDVDMANDIAKALNVAVVFNRDAATFNDVVTTVALGKADIGISKLSKTLTRAQIVGFSDSYLSLKHALLINRVEFAKHAGDVSLIKSIRNFDGTLGVIQQSSFAGWATQHFPNAKLVQFESWKQALDALRQGQVVALYRDEFEVRRVFSEDSKAVLTLRSVTFNDLEDNLGIAVAPNRPMLLNVVNEYLRINKKKMVVRDVLKLFKNR